MDDTERALVAGICAAPADDTARLVYADYLDERERHERAEFIRVQVALTRLGDKGNCSRCNVTLSPLRKDRFRLLAGCTKCGCQGGFWSDAVKSAKEEASLRAREKALFGHAGTAGFFDTLPGAYRNADSSRMQITTADQLKYGVRRGFVDSLECSTVNFLKHADALVWNPKQTAVCPTCHGVGMVRGEYSTQLDQGCVTCDGGHVPRPCPETAQPITKVALKFADDSGDELVRFLVVHKFTTTLVADSYTGTSPKWPDIEFELPRLGGGNLSPHVVAYAAAGDGFLPAEGWLIEPRADQFEEAGSRNYDLRRGEREFSLFLTYSLPEDFPPPALGNTFGPVTALTLDRRASVTVARAMVTDVQFVPLRYGTNAYVRARVIGDLAPLPHA